MAVAEHLVKVIEQLAESIDEPGYTGLKKNDSLKKYLETGMISAACKVPDFKSTGKPEFAGVHRKRPIFATLFQTGEMKMMVTCKSPCTFRITRNTLGARLNFLMGRKVLSGNEQFDRKYLVRKQSGHDLRLFLQRQDVAEFLDFLQPFYLIHGRSGSCTHLSNFDMNSIRAESVLEILERTIDFAEMLEEAFADHTAIEEINNDRMNKGIGGE